LFCGDGLINGVNTNTPQARLVSKNLTTNEAANGISYIPSISQNGDFAVFNSVASNLVAGDSYGYKDVFLYNKKLKTLKNITINGNYHSR
jgi:Tol biopolymer transport system component